MDDIIVMSSGDGDIHFLKKMPRINGEESRTYVVKTPSPFLRIDYGSDGRKFLRFPGGTILMEGEICEKTGTMVRFIDSIEGFGHVITFE